MYSLSDAEKPTVGENVSNVVSENHGYSTVSCEFTLLRCRKEQQAAYDRIIIKKNLKTRPSGARSASQS